jgi:hypothetical protein
MTLEIRPAPTEDEAAAIVAALELVWPRPSPAAAPGAGGRPPVWRFSGRWWSRPAAARRDRPWWPV